MGSGSVLIGSRSQAATIIQAVRPDSISQTGTTTCLCRLTFIVFQQAAQPFPTAHLFLFSWDCWSPQGEQQEVAFALVISFLVIVGLVVARDAVLSQILLALRRIQLHGAVEQLANLLPTLRCHAAPPRLIS